MYEIKQGDCIELMSKLPDKSVDMILCDLPYGTTKNKWDCVINLEELWSQYERLIKDNGCICLFAQTPFDKVLGSSNLKLLKYEIIWQKENATRFLNANKMPLKIHENILIFYKKLPVYNPQMRKGFKPYKCVQGSGSSSYNYNKNFGGHITENNGERYPIDVIEFKRDKDKLHPTQKPVALLEYLIKTYTNENMLVLDNCMGSGSTGIACLNTNRKFIGFELDKEYFEIAKKRIEDRSKELEEDWEDDL